MVISILIILSFLLSAFLIGSIPSGYIIGHIYGVDIREHGSKNIGATNIGRVLGKKAAILTFLADFFKGLLAVVLLTKVYNLLYTNHLSFLPPSLGIGVIMGHCYSPFLRFKGGKGVATSFGAFIIIAPYATGISFLVFVIIQQITSFVSLGSIAAACSFPLACFLLSPICNHETIWAGILVAVIIVWRHKDNIKRLISNKELKPS